jgi:hypothetical protein
VQEFVQDWYSLLGSMSTALAEPVEISTLPT